MLTPADIDYAVEDPEDFEADLRKLLPEHMAEFDIYGPPFQSSPNFAIYKQMAKAGVLAGITARYRGELIGYWLGIRFVDPHHLLSGNPVGVAMSVAFYIVPEWRPRIAKYFFRAVEIAMEKSGVSLLAQRVRRREGDGDFLRAIGYTVAEVVYVKPIGEAAKCLISA